SASAEGHERALVRPRAGEAIASGRRVAKARTAACGEGAVVDDVERLAQPRVAAALRVAREAGAAADQRQLAGERVAGDRGHAYAAHACVRVGAAQAPALGELREGVARQDERGADDAARALERPEPGAD